MSKKLTYITEVETSAFTQVEVDLDEVVQDLKSEQLLALNKKIVERLEELGIKPEFSKYEIIEKNKKENKSILNYAE